MSFLDHSPFQAASAYFPDDEELVRRFMPLVRKLAWHLAGSTGPSLDVDDLMQAGLVALTQCARRHDRPGQDGFAAYAKMRIRGEMIDCIRRSAPDTRNATQSRKRIDLASGALRQRLGREPSDAELAGELRLSVEELAELQFRAAPLRQQDLADCYDDSNSAFADTRPDAEAQLLRVEDRDRLTAAIAALPDRLQLVVQLYFLEELNLSEIAEILGVSVPRVHQLKANALAALRVALAD